MLKEMQTQKICLRRSSAINQLLTSKARITIKRDDDLAEWYTQILTRGKFISYYDIQGIESGTYGISMGRICEVAVLTIFSGCYILEPSIYFIWEQVKEYFDKKIRTIGVDSCWQFNFIPS